MCVCNGVITSLVPLLLVSIAGFAQSFNGEPDPHQYPALEQQGSLFNIRIVLGEPIRFFVVGKEEAKLNPADLSVTVRRLKPYPGKVLSLNRRNDYFTVEDSNELKDATALEVTTRTKAKSETLQFQIDNKKP